MSDLTKNLANLRAFFHEKWLGSYKHKDEVVLLNPTRPLRMIDIQGRVTQISVCCASMANE